MTYRCYSKWHLFFASNKYKVLVTKWVVLEVFKLTIYFYSLFIASGKYLQTTILTSVQNLLIFPINHINDFKIICSLSTRVFTMVIYLRKILKHYNRFYTFIQFKILGLLLKIALGMLNPGLYLTILKLYIRWWWKQSAEKNLN